MPILKKSWLTASDTTVKRMEIGGGLPLKWDPELESARAADVAPIPELVSPADIPVFEISDPIVFPDDAHERLTLLAGDLTSESELQRLTEKARDLARFRVRAGRFRMPFWALGFGTNYSEKYRYRSPRAQELRSRLWPDYSVLLVERPESVQSLEDARKFMAEYFAKITASTKEP